MSRNIGKNIGKRIDDIFLENVSISVLAILSLESVSIDIGDNFWKYH